MLTWRRDSKTSKEEMFGLVSDHLEFLNQVLETYRESFYGYIPEYLRAKEVIEFYQERAEEYRSVNKIYSTISQSIGHVSFSIICGVGLCEDQAQEIVKTYDLKLSKDN